MNLKKLVVDDGFGIKVYENVKTVENEAFYKPPMPKSPHLHRDFEIICNDGTRVKIDHTTICKFEF